MKKIVACLGVLLVLAVILLCCGAGPALAELPGINLGATYKSMWAVPPGGTLGAAEPMAAVSATGSFIKGHTIVLAEFGTVDQQGNQFVGAWAGYAHRDGFYLAGGLDSRFLLQQAGAGPSAILGAIIPLTEGTKINIQSRYSWWGRDNGSTVSLGFGYLTPF
jgi:hypothetical protein